MILMNSKGGHFYSKSKIWDLNRIWWRDTSILLKKLGKIIKFGATVKVEDEDTDEKSTYQIVGEHEADIKSGRLSVTSPMARAMIGKTVADSVEVTTPSGTKSYEIMSVRYK